MACVRSLPIMLPIWDRARQMRRALYVGPAACGQGAVLSLCMVRPGSGRFGFGVGFWVGFWVGLRARDFPTERVLLSRTPLIIRTVDQYCAAFWLL